MGFKKYKIMEIENTDACRKTSLGSSETCQPKRLGNTVNSNILIQNKIIEPLLVLISDSVNTVIIHSLMISQFNIVIDNIITPNSLLLWPPVSSVIRNKLNITLWTLVNQ